MTDNYRYLQRLCERQAALTTTLEARKFLEEMATQYRKMAEFRERQQTEYEDRNGDK